ncbi:MAG: EF-P beta-lysylation protein EpmB [Gammaproteobacteria bacterium]|jgi:EF-P beta-lysylation protein EpmB
MSAESYRDDIGNRTGLTRLGERNACDPEPRWQRQLSEAVRELGELERLLDLPAGSLASDTVTAVEFPLLVPRAFVARMQKRDPTDPLLRQVLPTAAEGHPAAGFVADPLGELGLTRDGSISKYPGRVLLITTGACPLHCRYCFRREFPYSRETAARNEWRAAVATIRNTPHVHEVILSGGDPLSLSNERLARLIAELETIPGLETLRIHTRFPIALPARVDRGLVELLSATRLNTVVVVHTNHPAEIDDAVRTAANELKNCSSYLLNQSVLLRGVNDSADTLIELSKTLLSAGILPYYVHLLDRVSGAAHFEVDADEGAEIVATMRRRAPGYLIPSLVRDTFGELSKTPIA